MKTTYAIASLVFAALLCTGCVPDEICRLDTNIVAGLECRWDSVTNEGTILTMERWDDITMHGIGKDSLLYDGATNIEQLGLPLRKDSGEVVTAFLLRRRNTDDTLWIKHKNESHFESMACGCFVYHHIDTVWATKHFIDSVYIVNSNVTPFKEEHIRAILQ